MAVGFVQGTPGARSIVVAGFDRRPGGFRLTSSSATWRNVARTPLRWGAAFDLWGPITYTVQVDGRNVAQTTNTAAAVPALPDGIHRWRVVATDPRGQTVGTARRTLRSDGRPPRARISVSGAQRRNRPVRIRVRASDAHPRGRRASGIRRISVAFGDGARTSSTRAAHRYRRAGRYTIRVTVRDRANNVTIVRKRVRIR